MPLYLLHYFGRAPNNTVFAIHITVHRISVFPYFRLTQCNCHTTLSAFIPLSLYAFIPFMPLYLLHHITVFTTLTQFRIPAYPYSRTSVSPYFHIPVNKK